MFIALDIGQRETEEQAPEVLDLYKEQRQGIAPQQILFQGSYERVALSETGVGQD